MHTLTFQVTAIKDMSIADIVARIQTKQQAFDAQIRFNAGALLQVPNDLRVPLCKALLARCKALEAPANSTWRDVIQNPEIYDLLADNIDTGVQ